MPTTHDRHITISVVFFPIVFIGGLENFCCAPCRGGDLRDLTSRCSPSTFLPVAAARFLRAPRACKRTRSWFERVRARYTSALERVLNATPCSLTACCLFVDSIFASSARTFPQLMLDSSPSTGATTGLRGKDRGVVARIENAIGAVIPGEGPQDDHLKHGRLLDWRPAYTELRPQDAFILGQLASIMRVRFSLSMSCAKTARDNFPGSSSTSTRRMLSRALNGGCHRRSTFR